MFNTFFLRSVLISSYNSKSPGSLKDLNVEEVIKKLTHKIKFFKYLVTAVNCSVYCLVSLSA